MELKPTELCLDSQNTIEYHHILISALRTEDFDFKTVQYAMDVRDESDIHFQTFTLENFMAHLTEYPIRGKSFCSCILTLLRIQNMVYEVFLHAFITVIIIMHCTMTMSSKLWSFNTTQRFLFSHKPKAFDLIRINSLRDEVSLINLSI